MTTPVRRILASLLVLGVLGAVLSVGALSAFTSQVDNNANGATSGTVVLTDDDNGSALYDVPAARPGDSTTACLRVSYTGTLAAEVRLYTPSAIGTLGAHVNLRIEPGTQASSTFPDCGGFAPDGPALFDAALSTFPGTHASGVQDAPGSAATWAPGDAVVYRVTASLSASAPNSAQGQGTGPHTLRWEARDP